MSERRPPSPPTWWAGWTSEGETVREEFVERVAVDLGAGACGHVHLVDRELRHDLAALAARVGRRHIGGVDAGHRHRIDLAYTFGHRPSDGVGLGTRRRGIGRVLDVGSGVGEPVGSKRHGSYPELRV